MAAAPPPLPVQDRWRRATMVNWLVPGAGLFLIGRRKSGALLASLFFACFGAALVLFVIGYAHYWSTALSEDLLAEGRLEQMDDGFHRGWLLTLAVIAVGLQILSFILLSREKKKNAS